MSKLYREANPWHLSGKMEVPILSTVHSTELAQFADRLGKGTTKPAAARLQQHNGRSGPSGAGIIKLFCSKEPKEDLLQKHISASTWRGYIQCFCAVSEKRCESISSWIPPAADCTHKKKCFEPAVAQKKGWQRSVLVVQRLNKRHFPSYLTLAEKRQKQTRHSATCCLKSDKNGKHVRKELSTSWRCCKKALWAVLCSERWHTSENLK